MRFLYVFFGKFDINRTVAPLVSLRVRVSSGKEVYGLDKAIEVTPCADHDELLTNPY